MKNKIDPINQMWFAKLEHERRVDKQMDTFLAYFYLFLPIVAILFALFWVYNF
jgi:hypothetical protein